MFALEQLFSNVFSSRANIRFAPTLGSPQRFHLAETMIKAKLLDSQASLNGELIFGAFLKRIDLTLFEERNIMD